MARSSFMVIRYLNLMFVVCLFACQNKQASVNVEQKRKKDIVVSLIKNELNTNQNIADTLGDYATYFVVVADTGTDYYILRNRMMALNRQLSVPVDTMGRYYNKTKNLIALPDNDEDEIYAGDYFPRRYPSQSLSLEYLSFYNNKAAEKTIALVTGIYENENSADSAVAVFHKTKENVFKLKSNIYIGCMH